MVLGRGVECGLRMRGKGRTGSILPPADLNEFLDILYLLRHLAGLLLVERKSGLGRCWREIDTSRALTKGSFSGSWGD